jgi:hypothetical protein
MSTDTGSASVIQNQRPLLTAFSIFLAALVALCYAAFHRSISSVAGEMRTLLAPRQLPSLPVLPEQQNAIHDDSSGGASWGTLVFFVHITDLHLSHLQPERSRRFASFLDRVLPAVRPRAVLVSGDLVHANLRSGESQQVVAEWREYRSILESRSLWDPNMWHDIRGNHDALNTWRLSPLQSSLSPPDAPMHSRLHARRAIASTLIGSALDHSAESDPFSNFSVSGAHARPGSFELTIEGRRIRAFDQTPRTGLHRFFNFFGHLDQGVESKVGIDIAFGHYPLFMVDRANAMTHDASGVLAAASHGWSHLQQGFGRLSNAPRPILSPPPLVYLCGHLHDGLGERLHAR